MEHGSGPTAPIRPHRQWTPLARALAATGDRWTLLIVLALSHERLRLNVLRQRLPGVSSGVLDHHLSQMITLGLLSRERFREMPPRVEVELTQRGCELLPIAGALARWGMRNEWPMPESREHVRADAILRQLPALLEEITGLPDGLIEVSVGGDSHDGDSGTGSGGCRLWLKISDGRLRRVEELDGAMGAPTATARVEGDEDAWSAALGPGGDYSGLRFAGKRSTTERLLDSLPRDIQR